MAKVMAQLEKCKRLFCRLRMGLRGTLTRSREIVRLSGIRSGCAAASREFLARRPPRSNGSAAGELLHHEAGAAARHVRNDGRTAMDLGDESQVDGERELHMLSLAQTEILRLDEHAVGAQILGLADPALTPRHHHIDRGTCAVAGVQTTLHSLE